VGRRYLGGESPHFLTAQQKQLAGCFLRDRIAARDDLVMMRTYPVRRIVA